MLAAAFAALPSLPAHDLSTDEWLGLGLGVALLACAGLAVAVLALAREVGMLRLRLGPGSALEVIGEGPDVGSRQPVISRFEIGPDTEFALAVFTSRGCHVCHGLAPAIASLANDPILAVLTFEEIDDSRGLGRALDSRAAPTRSPSTPRARCSPRAPSTTSPSSRASSPRPSAAAPTATSSRRWVSEQPTRVERAFEGLARRTPPRRGFLARVGGGADHASPPAAWSPRRSSPADAERYYGFCGHTYTTAPLPAPDRAAADRRAAAFRCGRPTATPIDDLGRPVNGKGQPLGDDGKLLRDPDGRPLPPAPRTKVCDETARRFGMKTYVDGSWYRCCNGHVRALKDCCSYSNKRINGDAALTGYCYARPQGLLRDVLPDQGALLSGLEITLIASRRCSRASAAPGRRAASR